MKKSGDKQTQTDKHTTPTRGRIIVADGIYSVGDKKNILLTRALSIEIIYFMQLIYKLWALEEKNRTDSMHFAKIPTRTRDYSKL